jgi:ubiquinone/menaquinone biosynthesis C-methylase UbiE
MRTFESQREAWRRIPVDDAAYLDVSDLLQLEDRVLLHVAQDMERRRYVGWRNHDNLWRQHMGLDSVTGKRILDYGCGFGIEAVQYARNDNRVVIADQNNDTVLLAERVMYLYGFEPVWHYVIDVASPPFLAVDDSEFDLIVMNGVLHHIEDPVPVVREMHRWLAREGELRVMVYTDRAWCMATDTEPPADVTDHPAREKFVRWGDEVGDWADWYNRERLEQRFGEWFTVREWHYITPDDRYGIAIMDRR